MPADRVTDPGRSYYLELETASFRADRICNHAGLLSLAADAMISDGDGFNGRKVKACADAIEEQLDNLAIELKKLSEIWRIERMAKSI